MMVQNIENISKVTWITIPGDTGYYFTIKDRWIAGVEDKSLVIWYDNQIFKQVLSPTFMGGFPRIHDSIIYWGNGYYDLDEGQFVQIEAIQSLFGAGGFPIAPHALYIPETFAWSPDGKYLLISMQWKGEPGPPQSKVVLTDINFSKPIVLLEEEDFPPRSAWLDSDWLILGTRSPKIYDYKGNLIGQLKGDLLPERLETSDRGKHLIIQDYNSLNLWDTKDWTLERSWEGPWLDTSISPSGNLMAAVDFNGSIYLINPNDKASDLQQIETPDPVTSIRLGENQMIASFGRGTPIRVGKFGPTKISDSVTTDKKH